MSAIAAVIRMDGRPSDLAVLSAMLDAIAYRGGDRRGSQQNGAAALGIEQRFVTHEDRDAEQPFVAPESHCQIVFDGFLANADDVRRDVVAAGGRPRGASDAELVALCYDLWGDRFPERLDGEFALIVWDPRRRALLAARDPVGARPLVYHFDGRTLLIASDIAAVLAALPERPRFETAYLLQALTGLQYCAEDTPWQGVRRLPPAHLIIFKNGALRETRYWEPDLDARIKHKSDAEYQEHYLAMLTDCVRRWSRSEGPIACHVSGGLDSSAVFAVADRLLTRGELNAPGILGFAYDAPSGTTADEEFHSRAAEEYVGRAVRRIPLTMPDLGFFIARGQADLDLPPYPNGVMSIGLTDAAVAAGCRVHMGGIGGDNWLDGTLDYYREDLTALRFGAVADSLRRDVAAIGPRETARRFLVNGVGRALPGRVTAAVRTLLRRPAQDDLAAFDWLTSEAIALHEQRRDAWVAQLAQYPARHQYKIAKLRSPQFQRSLRELDRQSARYGAEVRLPMFSRDFIAFSCATPERLRLRGNRTKDIHRRALAGLLPPSVLDRTTKAYFDFTITRHYGAIDAALRGSPPRTMADLISRDASSRLLHEEYGEIDSWPVFPIWNFLTVWSLTQNR